MANEQETELQRREALETYLAFRAAERDVAEHRKQAYADYIAAGGTPAEASGAWRDQSIRQARHE